jgi:branched-chain amino acid aminotransferase
MINFNGQLSSKEDFRLSLNNRAFRFGDSLYEEIKIAGETILFWESHYFRLMAGMRLLRMKIPIHFDMEFLEAEILKTCAYRKTDAHLIRLTICRKDNKNLLTKDQSVDFYIEITDETEVAYKPFSGKFEVDLYKDFFENPSLLSTIEASSNLIPILSKIFADENGLDDCLILNADKNVIGASVGNLFLVKGYSVLTPPAEDGCKKGILRNEIIKLIKKSALYQLEETSISPFELQSADELFLAHITFGIIPVSKYRKKEYARQTADYILENLNLSIREIS